MFSLLAAWLIKKSGKAFEKPQEFDDPNATISNILEVIRGNVRLSNKLQNTVSHTQ